MILVFNVFKKCSEVFNVFRVPILLSLERVMSKKSEDCEIPTMQITCFDGTILEIPDDNRVEEYLGGVSINEIFVDSSRIPRASRKYIVSRPPLLVRLKHWFRVKLSKIKQ